MTVRIDIEDDVLGSMPCDSYVLLDELVQKTGFKATHVRAALVDLIDMGQCERADSEGGHVYRRCVPLPCPKCGDTESRKRVFFNRGAQFCGVCDHRWTPVDKDSVHYMVMLVRRDKNCAVCRDVLLEEYNVSRDMDIRTSPTDLAFAIIRRINAD